MTFPALVGKDIILLPLGIQYLPSDEVPIFKSILYQIGFKPRREKIFRKFSLSLVTPGSRKYPALPIYYIKMNTGTLWVATTPSFHVSSSCMTVKKVKRMGGGNAKNNEKHLNLR